MQHFRTSLLLGCLVLSLSACTVTFRPNSNVRVVTNAAFDFGNAITHFAPDRGQGSTYYPGESIAFRITTRQAGYVTLTVRDPDGSIDVFSINQRVPAGTSTISGIDSRSGFMVTPPYGRHEVRVSLTPSPTSGRVSYRGNYSRDIWTQSIVTDLRPFPVESRGYYTTSFHVR